MPRVGSCSALDFGVEQTWENMMKESGWADPTLPDPHMNDNRATMIGASSVHFPVDLVFVFWANISVKNDWLGVLPFGDSRKPTKPKRKRKSRAKGAQKTFAHFSLMCALGSFSAHFGRLSATVKPVEGAGGSAAAAGGVSSAARPPVLERAGGSSDQEIPSLEQGQQTT